MMTFEEIIEEAEKARFTKPEVIRGMKGVSSIYSRATYTDKYNDFLKEIA